VLECLTHTSFTVHTVLTVVRKSNLHNAMHGTTPQEDKTRYGMYIFLLSDRLQAGCIQVLSSEREYQAMSLRSKA